MKTEIDWIDCRCRECGKAFLHAKPGRVPDYCANACRQRAFYWTFKIAHGVRYKKRAGVVGAGSCSSPSHSSIDPKLRDCGARRGSCVVGLPGAATVTRGAVLCSAWLAVAVDCMDGFGVRWKKTRRCPSMKTP
jgi:hypothetical protein